ncbi:TPR repeat-containing protein DDB_G0287407-like [Lytechinus variegatus]|uniref:TPR repeat-containing protein DDB_G0287407-like n=1 Tax=Lytechinus variegatus TaxID=7654 RepID=UPI001BB1E117|nr:TPR repeat-containing protein DDB_G0287407-like [Lytechinus variegatus]
MQDYSQSPPTISLEEFNDGVFPREKHLPYNMNAGHGGASAILLHTRQRQSTTQSQLSLVQSGFNSNTFNTKLIVTSRLGIPAARDNGRFAASIARDLQTNHDGDLIMKMRDGRHDVTLFSNQAIFTRGGRFPQRECSPEGNLDVSLQELGFVHLSDTVEYTVSVLVGCSTSRSDESTPVACCYMVEVQRIGDCWKLDAVPAGKCGPNEMKNNWKFDINQDGFFKIEGPPDSHFVFLCNRSYAEDTPDTSPCGKVFFTQTYNGEHSTTLVPKIRTHYGRAMFLLCSRSNPDTNLVTSALYFVAPMVNKVGVYYIAESTDDPSLSTPALWLVSKKIGKLAVRLKPDLTGPCRYAFFSNAPEDLEDVETRCLQSDCIATGADTPLRGHLSIIDGCLNVWTDRRVDIKIESGNHTAVVVHESELEEKSGRFTFQKDVSNEIKEGKGVYVFRASVNLKNKERRDVTIELEGSPCRVMKQLPGVQFAINFGGPAYQDVNGALFVDGRSALPSICSDPDRYYYGCHIDPLRNYPQVVGSTNDGSLYTTFIGNRPRHDDTLDFRIPMPGGRYVLTLFAMSSGLDDVTALVNGDDLSTQIQQQLHSQTETIPECTAKKASLPVTVSDGTLDISLKSDKGIQLSALLVQSEDTGIEISSNELSSGQKQEIGDDLAPLDRHIAGYDIRNLAWSGDILRMRKEYTPEGDSTQWQSQLGGDGVEKRLVLTGENGVYEYHMNLEDSFDVSCLDNAPPVQFSLSLRSPATSGSTYQITLTLERSDGTVVQTKCTNGTLERSDTWSRVILTVGEYSAGSRSVRITTEVAGRGIEVSAFSLRMKCRRPHRTGLKDTLCDVKIIKDTKKLVTLIRGLVQKYGLPTCPMSTDRPGSESSISTSPQASPLNLEAYSDDGKPAASEHQGVGKDGTKGQGGQVLKHQRKKREIRVFLSSTFLDFTAEREILIKKVFNEIKKMCLDRGVFFSYVDLRWGITSDQSNDGKTLSICLREIDRCRPYFLCIIGDRFGWSQREGEVDELLNKSYDYAIANFNHLKWIDEYRFNSSVTQLEVLHSALRDRENASDKTFFYLRKAKTKDELLSKTGHEPEWKIDQQKEFRQTLEESGLLVRHYDVADDGTDLIRKDLEMCINQDFPPESKLTPLQREHEAHLSFAEVRRRVYIGRAEYFTKIDDYFAGNPKLPFVVLGESGSGKSALVANWCGRFEDEHPGDFMFMHFIGSSADSASHLRLLRRLFEELKQHFNIDMGIPTSDKSLAQDLPKWLSLAGSCGRRVLIVLDALNQLDSGAAGEGDELELKWLPLELPPNVQMLLSTLPGKALDAVKSNNWPVFHVHPLNQEEKGEIIRCYMELYSKNLNTEQTDLIVNAKQTSNALYLRALLDEVRVYGSFYQLTSSIKNYLEAQDPGQLFVKVLERLESDFEQGEHGRPNLVRDATCALWCSSRGLSEEELTSFLQVPSRIWSPFYLSLEENLVNRNGIVNFFHDHLRQAVERKYVSVHAEKRRNFLNLAEFFEKQDINERYVEELPALLMELSDLPRLKKVVMIPKAFQLLMNTSEGKVRLIQAWRMLGGFEQAGQAYLEFVNHSKAFSEVKEKESLLACLTDFFTELGILKIARQLNERLLSTLEDLHAGSDVCHVTHHVRYETKKTSRHRDVIENLLELGIVCQKLADYTAATAYFEDALNRLSHPDTVEHRLQMIKALTGLGQAYSMTSQPLEAQRFYLKALEICDQVLPVNHHYTATLNGLIGELHQNQGRATEALQYHILDILETQRTAGLGKPRVAAILNNIGLSLMDLDPMGEDALPFFVEALSILIDAYGPVHVDVASVRMNIAAYFFNAKLYKYSLFQYKRAFEIFKVYMGSLHPKSQEARQGQKELRPFTMVQK